jgi:hypothetical protein
LIQRLPDQADRRGPTIKLTAAGLKIVDRILPHLIRLENNMAAGLNGEQGGRSHAAFGRIRTVSVATARAVMMRTQMPATSLWLWLAPEGATGK